MKKEIAVINLGDCRLPFYETRRHIADEETKYLIAALEKKYTVFSPTPVFNIDEGLAVADEIRRRLISQIIIHIPIWCTPNFVFRIASAEQPVDCIC